jgi:hypothetical protein
VTGEPAEPSAQVADLTPEAVNPHRTES